MKIKITEKTGILSQKQLEDDIISHIDENVDNIETNGNIATILCDSSLYKLLSLNKDQKIYTVGLFNNITLNVNTYQKWDDNKIYLKKDNEIILEIEIIDENNWLI